MTCVVRQGLPKTSKNDPAQSALRDGVFQPEFRDDLRYWVEKDRRTALRIMTLIEAIMRDPFTGQNRSGIWGGCLVTADHSRARLVYLVSNDRIDVLQARYHYTD
jgi:toxin YoeB